MNASPTDATTLDLTYACAECETTTLVTVSGLTPPRQLRDARTMERHAAVRRRLDDLRGETSDPVSEIDAEILRGQAEDVLRYATCPRCGKRCAEGLARASAEARTSKIVSVLLYVGLGVLSYFFPPTAWGMVVIAGVFTVVQLVHLRRGERPMLRPALVGLATVGALGALLLFLPRLVFLAPTALGLRLLLAAPVSADARFALTRERLRFHGVGYRDAPFAAATLTPTDRPRD